LNPFSEPRARIQGYIDIFPSEAEVHKWITDAAFDDMSKSYQRYQEQDKKLSVVFRYHELLRGDERYHAILNVFYQEMKEAYQEDTPLTSVKP